VLLLSTEISQGKTGFDAGFRCHKLFQEFLSDRILPRGLGQLCCCQVAATKAGAGAEDYGHYPKKTHWRKAPLEVRLG
jgi:hypothetical protein